MQCLLLLWETFGQEDRVLDIRKHATCRDVQFLDENKVEDMVWVNLQMKIWTRFFKAIEMLTWQCEKRVKARGGCA